MSREENIKDRLAEAESLIESAFLQIASRCDDGWYDTMALSTAQELGDYLVEKGTWERRKGGVGRRQFYRLIKLASVLSTTPFPSKSAK